MFKRYTVHRGMWHSIPAACMASLLAFMTCSCEDLNSRIFKCAAVGIGFLSHLILDEFWSLSFRGLRPRVKKSFGTAMKLWGDSAWANFSTYAKLILLAALATGDPVFMQWMGYHDRGLPQFAQKWVQELKQHSDTILR
ncbi:MAG: metal-dependent hydrolase [Pirellulaceae bacterium]